MPSKTLKWIYENSSNNLYYQIVAGFTTFILTGFLLTKEIGLYGLLVIFLGSVLYLAMIITEQQRSNRLQGFIIMDFHRDVVLSDNILIKIKNVRQMAENPDNEELRIFENEIIDTKNSLKEFIRKYELKGKTN